MPYNYPIRWTILLLLLCWAACEEWYIPNSRMISDVEFKQKIENDNTTYKLVKFFIPNCVYCRYLKGVIDDLKAEKKWPFEIYDFNCAWYPALCNRLQIGSYPFTGIFDPKGQLEDKIGGFYPYPVMKQYFQKIEKQTQEFTSSTNTLSIHQEDKPALSIDAEKTEQKLRQQARPMPVVNQQQVAKIEQDKKEQQKVEEQKGVKQEKGDKVEKLVSPQSYIQHSNNMHLDGISQHIFYSICILLGVIYFSSFANKDKFANQSHSAPNNPESATSTALKIGRMGGESVV